MRYYERYTKTVTEERLVKTVCDLCGNVAERPWRLETPVPATHPTALELTLKYKVLDLCHGCRELLQPCGPVDVGKAIEYFGHWRSEARELLEKDGALRKEPRHPVEPLIDGIGGVRFKGNQVVRFVYNARPTNMNPLDDISFPREDRVQFAQLMGWPLRTFSNLPYVDDEDIRRAEAQ